MTTNNSKSIGFYKPITSLMALGCILVALLFFFNRNDPELNMDSSFVYWIILLGSLLFGFGGIQIFRRSFKYSQSAIEINQKGVIVRNICNEKLTNYILWKDVADVEMGAYGKVCIKFKSPEMSDTEISSWLYDISKEDLFTVLLSYVKQYGNKQ